MKTYKIKNINNKTIIINFNKGVKTLKPNEYFFHTGELFSQIINLEKSGFILLTEENYIINKKNIIDNIKSESIKVELISEKNILKTKSRKNIKKE